MKDNIEQKWIRRIKIFGSKKDADLLVHAYYDEIYRYVCKQLSNNNDTYDLTQEIFISMLHSIKTYKKDQASFRTWLYRIATNKIIDHRRKCSLKLISLDEINVADEIDFTKQIEQADLLMKIEKYISHFLPLVQQIYRLHIYGDFTFTQIAADLDISESTVKSYYYRLQKKIRKEFYDEYKGIIKS